MLRTELITAINGILNSDPGITAEEKERILKACRPPKAGPPITAREAMKMLEISRPTLRSYSIRDCCIKSTSPPEKCDLTGEKWNTLPTME